MSFTCGYLFVLVGLAMVGVGVLLSIRQDSNLFIDGASAAMIFSGLIVGFVAVTFWGLS